MNICNNVSFSSIGCRHRGNSVLKSYCPSIRFLCTHSRIRPTSITSAARSQILAQTHMHSGHMFGPARETASATFRLPAVTSPQDTLMAEEHTSLVVPEEKFSLTLRQLIALSETPASEVFSSGIVSSAADLAKRLGTSLDSGLTSDISDFEERARILGTNRLPEPKETTFWELVWEAFQDFTIIILVVAGVVSLILESIFSNPGENGWIEGAAILFAVAGKGLSAS